LHLWTKHLFWMVGMILLLMVSFHFEHVASLTSQKTFRVIHLIWINSTISFVLGAYLSLLFINLKFQVDKPLLVCVFIPSTLIGFYIPLAATFSLPLPMWVSTVNTHDFPTILSSLSLMVALFNEKSPVKRQPNLHGYTL